jgi:PAS domain S-box-containing protein
MEIYQSIIEYNPDAIFVLSVDGKIKEVNQMVTNIFGYSKEDLQEKYFKELIVPKQIEEVCYHFNKVLQRLPFENKFDAYHKNGQILHLQVKSVPLIVLNEIVGIFCVVKDLTELQMAKQMEERFKSLFNSTADAINILNLDGNIIDVNPEFEKLYGWEKEEIIGKPLPNISVSELAESK